MVKIGRNDPCPCGSGRKYKKCCLRRQASATLRPEQQLRITLMSEIEKIQASAARHEEAVRQLGVFILWSNVSGNAWILEITESDAVQVARAGEALAVPINENPETIEVNWSHTFVIRDRRFYLTSYEDGRESLLDEAPARRINAALRRIRKKFTEEQLNRVHISPAEQEGE